MSRKPAIAALAGLAIAITPAQAGVVFSESFEDPVVSGFAQNTVPSGGNWIGASDGFGSSNRGLYNETVAWPATPAFTTPYGEQAYFLNYTNSGLTTSVGATGQTLTADVTYSVKFNAAVTAGTASGNYRLELVAFGPTEDNTARRDVNGTMPGSVLATASGAVTTNDMSAVGSLTFTPDSLNAHLGKDLGIRLVKSSGSVLYDNIRLITGHDLNPSPADGEDLANGGNVTLSWTNMPPTGAATYVDVWFGTTSGALTQQLVNGQITSSTIASAPTAGTYYWRVDSYPDGNPNGTPVVGQEFFFTIADTDGDGFPDDYELAHTSPPSNTALNPGDDLEPDGLTNLQEYQYGTDPNNPDSDGDTLLDGAEINGTAGSRPATNPLLADTDGDGLNDDVETNTGVWVSSADTGTNPTDTDWDNDGLSDGVETKTGTFVSRTTDTGTDPYLFDSDSDGAGDWYEVAGTFTDPNSATETSAIPYPLPDPDPADLGTPGAPVKVFIMAGQSNTVGIGYINEMGEPGSLSTIAKLENKFPNLVDGSNNWTARNDVIYKGVVTATAAGPLTAGQGSGTDTIGPELGFGHVMGWYLGEPVLIIKASQGNRSLGWDFLPPDSPRFEIGATTYAGYGDRDSSWPTGEEPTPVNWYAGKQYDDCFRDESNWGATGFPAITNAADILDFTTGTLQGLPTTGNDLNGRTFEIAGFCWWQGHKDHTDAVYAPRYELNLVNLINKLRADFQAPSAPVVVASIGFGGGDIAAKPALYQKVYNAQMAVGDPVQYPAYENTVKSVDTLPYWRELDESPGGQDFHYNNNAETYMLVGDAMGRTMIELLEAAAGPDETPPVTVSLSPENGATGVSAGASLVANFNELIAIGSGNITLRNLPDDGPTGDVVIAVTDGSQVTFSGATLTINPTANLATSTQYAVLIDATAIDDLAGNGYAGIADNTTWSFTTAAPDLTAPSLSSTDPANGATVVIDADLEATFSEPIAIGSGNITLRNLTDGSGGDVLIDVTDGSQVSVSGAVLTINPAADLLQGKNYAVQIDATAIDDLVGNSYAGIGDDTTWFFSTPEPPPVGVVFFDNFETGGNPSALPATTGSYSTTPDVTTYTVANTSGQANSTLWVRATQGYGASRNGLVDESENTGASFTDPVGEQAYGFRYTNSGVTTAAGVIGSLTSGVTYTVTLDVVKDGFNNGTSYNLALVTFNGGQRDDVRANTGATSTLASLTGTYDGTTYQQVSFSYTADGTEATLGQDVAFRVFGATSHLIIDNVEISASGGGGGGNPFDDWAANYPGLTNTDPTLDFDGGGLETGLEWVLGGDPADGSDDAGIAPTLDNTSDPDFFIFTYRRADEAFADSNSTIAAEYGSDLVGWTEAVAGTDIVITPTNNGAGAGIDLVEVKIRRTLAVGGKLFTRLSVEVATP